MKRQSSPLSVALLGALCWLVLGSGLIGWAAGGDGRAVLGWLLLGTVLIAALTRPVRNAAMLAAAGGSAVFIAGDALLVWLDNKSLNTANLEPRVVTVTIAVLFITPFVLRWLLDEVERIARQVLYQSSVIEDLTIRDTSTGAFKTKYIEAILAEELDRARRYQRSLTLAILSADDWDLVVDDLGEVGARNLAARIVDQLAKGTRTVDKIVQMGDGGFAIVLPETPLEGAEVLAARLQASASAEAGVTLRIGMADFPRDAVTSEALVSEAQEALTFAHTADLLVVDRTLLGYTV
jgi:diguanylate cyclase (GGDEF)-like protein